MRGNRENRYRRQLLDLALVADGAARQLDAARQWQRAMCDNWPHPIKAVHLITPY